MKKKAVISCFLLIGFYTGWACTNFLVTKGASKDGSTMITYAADSHTLYGELYYRPAATYKPGDMFTVYEWDTGKKLGEIPQVAQTYSVVGNINEHQLAISETTYGGRHELEDTTGIIDYGSLIYITLQRAKNAREAIKVMAELVENYGYYSSGESISICDPNEVWIFEIIGKGGKSKGAVWVALKIPDGYISGHANHARITTFPLEGKKTKNTISSKNLKNVFNPEIECVYAHDVISFARQMGYIDATVKDADFSFSDTYAPLDFSGARGCEARVWCGFYRCSPAQMKPFEKYARGEDLKGQRLPLWIKPDQKLSVLDVMKLMRDHYEGTSMDMTKDIGAGPYEWPYRWRPMSFEVDGQKYLHERATATQQTGFSFLAQCRSQYSDPIGGIIWFGVDDASTSVYVPIFCGITAIPEAFKEGNGDMMTYSPTSAFWLFNLVSNWIYTRYKDMAPHAVKLQSELESGFMQEVDKFSPVFQKLYNEDRGKAIAALNNFSREATVKTMNAWHNLFYNYLLVKYIDGNIKKEEGGKFKNNGYNPRQAAFPEQPALPYKFRKAIVDDAGENLMSH